MDKRYCDIDKLNEWDAANSKSHWEKDQLARG